MKLNDYLRTDFNKYPNGASSAVEDLQFPVRLNIEHYIAIEREVM